MLPIVVLSAWPRELDSGLDALAWPGVLVECHKRLGASRIKCFLRLGVLPACATFW